jgi:hypothetical protein
MLLAGIEDKLHISSRWGGKVKSMLPKTGPAEVS